MLKTKVNILGNYQGVASAMTGLNNNYTYALNKQGNSGENEELRIVSNEVKTGSLSRINATVTAKKDIFITSLSALFIDGIAQGGDFQSGNIFLYLCRQTWEGEAQWQKISVNQLGFFQKSIHHSTDSFHIVNIGSFSTANVYPVFFIEDENNKKVWCFQFEPIGNYHMEIGFDKGGSCLFANFECVSDRYLQSGIFLKKGQSYSTEYVLYGEVEGNLNDALRALTAARRFAFPKNQTVPVVYNDYMNSLWGNPNEEKLLPLIDSAAEAGAEVFCIDAGWFMPQSKNWEQSLGDWNPSSDRFKTFGFSGIINYIQKKGLMAGCWLEMECASALADVFKNPDSWFLCKYGERIGGGSRYFLNFSNPEVCGYMRGKVKALYDMGIRYIKNDYNECIGSGVDFKDGQSLGIGVNRAVHAFLSFIDDLKNEFSDLIIENCGSGAMRSDYGVLSHFDLQSITDQEDHVLNHSITVGTLLNILPEFMGVWCYPFPLSFENMQTPEVLDLAEYKQNMADGEQTAFNMINGMLGNLYLSGRIDKADNKNFKLIQEGIRFYKSNRKYIFEGIPQLLSDIPSLSGKNEFSAVLFEHKQKNLLMIFRLGKQEKIKIDLKPYFDQCEVKIGYGDFGGKKIAVKENILTAHLPKSNSAIVLEITRR